MSALSCLKLVAEHKPRRLPEVVLRRNKLAAKIWEQIQLAKGERDGTPYAPLKTRKFKDPVTGLSQETKVRKRLRSWWWVSESGKVRVSIRYGTKTLELARGKPSVEVASADELIEALEIIKHAVEQGELDAEIAAASGVLKAGFKQ